MIILALDPAKLTGWYHSAGLGGVWDLGEPHYRLARIHALIMDFHRPFDCLVAEDAQIGSPNFVVQGMHAEIRGVIRLCSQLLNIPLVLIHPRSAKAFATGKGNATKAMMMRAAEIQFGVSFASDDQADAFWFCEYVKQGQHLTTPKMVRRRDKQRRKSEARLFR